MSNVKNVIALTQETVANSTTGDVNTDDNTLFVDKSDNKVGIGTNSPTYPLHVKSDGATTRTLIENANTGTKQSSVDLKNSTQYYRIINQFDNRFQIYDQTAGSARFTIDTSGSIGIGTTSGLSNTLNVEGTGRFTGNVTASYFKGNGSQLTGVSAGATGGGDDQLFFLSDQNVTTDYSIPSGKNALSAGPLTVNTGVTVTIPSGSAWTIV